MPIPWTLTIGGSAIDPAAKRVTLRTLQVDRRVTDQLVFVEHGVSYGATYTVGQTVNLEYPTSTDVFTGRIVQAEPSATGQDATVYTALGWRGLAANVAVTRYGANEAVPDGYPERIYNAPNDDPDRAFQALGPSATVGQIITDLFTDFLTTLRAEGACHASSTPYDAAELANLTFVPSKLVLANQNFDSAITAILKEQGGAWSIWVDSTGVWHFYDATAVATTTTLTIGDEVQQVNLARHLRDRYTAVKVYGRRGKGQQIYPAKVGMGTDQYGTTLSGLEIAWDPADEAAWNLEVGEGERDQGVAAVTSSSTLIYCTGRAWADNLWVGGYAIFPRSSYDTVYTITDSGSDSFQLSTAVPNFTVGDPFIIFAQGDKSDVFRKFRITDAALRDVVVDSVGDLDCCPHVVAVLRNEANEVVGTHTIDVRLEGDGYIRTRIPMFSSASNGIDVGDSVIHPDFYFVFCYRSTTVTATPLTARYPTSSYSGAASAAPYSVQRELAVAIDDYQDQDNPGIYATLAQEVHKLTSAVPVTGTLVLRDIDWTHLDPRRRIHLDHVNAEVTGWEALGAPVASVTFDLERATTTLELSTDGGSQSLDYQALLERIRAQARMGRVATESVKITDFINCRGKERTRNYRNENLNAIDPPTRVSTAVPQPSYTFPRGGADRTSSICNCDFSTDPCHKTQAIAAAEHRFICLPHDQHGLIVKHPGPSTGSNGFCTYSQMVMGGVSDANYTNPSAVEPQMYYPYVGQGVPIGDRPDNLYAATFTDGMRNLVVLEPTELDDGDDGTEIGIGAFALEFLSAYDNYMQHNEEAHCCIDNRMACVDQGVWGGTPCANGGGGCQNTIYEMIRHTILALTVLRRCVNRINYAPGEMNPGCPPVNINTDATGCGPC